MIVQFTITTFFLKLFLCYERRKIKSIGQTFVKSLKGNNFEIFVKYIKLTRITKEKKNIVSVMFHSILLIDIAPIFEGTN